MDSARDFSRISIEGIVGSGVGAFMWELESLGVSRLIWGEEESVLDGGWDVEKWESYVLALFSQWHLGEQWGSHVPITFYERSIWSVMTFALWEYRERFGMSDEDYQRLKTFYADLMSDDIQRPSLIVYFECAASHSPLPNTQFVALDELYETWLGLMESMDVQVLRVQSPKIMGLEREYWSEKLLEQIYSFVRATT
jgi:hypothetical protein